MRMIRTQNNRFYLYRSGLVYRKNVTRMNIWHRHSDRLAIGMRGFASEKKVVGRKICSCWRWRQVVEEHWPSYHKFWHFSPSMKLRHRILDFFFFFVANMTVLFAICNELTSDNVRIDSAPLHRSQVQGPSDVITLTMSGMCTCEKEPDDRYKNIHLRGETHTCPYRIDVRRRSWTHTPIEWR